MALAVDPPPRAPAAPPPVVVLAVAFPELVLVPDMVPRLMVLEMLTQALATAVRLVALPDMAAWAQESPLTLALGCREAVAAAAVVAVAVVVAAASPA